MRQTGLITDDDGPTTGSVSHAADRARDTELVMAARAGDPDAFGRLYDAWFDRVHALVLRIVRDRDVAEEVCQDCFLTAWRSLDGLRDPASFGGWLLRIARNRSFDRAGTEARSTPVDDGGLAVIEGTGSGTDAAPAGLEVGARLARAERPEIAAQDAEVAALVREATTALSERDAEALDLQLRYELTPAEIGEVMGINRNAANQLCHRARARFATAFGARMLWRGSRPACPLLETELAAAGVAGYGSEAVAIADRHASDCDDCDERRRLRLEPSALFGALPLLAAPALLKAKVAGALASSGVPMSGSAALPGVVSGAVSTVGPANSSGAGPGEGAGAEHGGGLGEPAAADGLDPYGSSARTATGSNARRMLVGAGAAIVALLVVIGLLVWNRGSSDRALATDTGLPTLQATVPTTASDAGSDAAVPADSASNSTPSTSPPGSSTTASTTPPTTIVAPVVQQLTVSPVDDRPPTWPVDSGPRLTWAVTGADAVEVWLWSDTGGGPSRTRVLSTQPSGSLTVCPGTVGAGTCSTPPGTYLFVIEATNAVGTVVSSDAAPAPQFVVYTIIS
jgi:RNA polymerase sigma factor (sigma-70 family)